MLIRGLDTETTGVDVHHSARPFLVTICDQDGSQAFWEWEVDPLTRMPLIPDSDKDEIRCSLSEADLLVMHNSKFDVAMLAAIGIEVDWARVRDTLLASHLLASNHLHNLTDVCTEYLGIDIEPWEKRIKEATTTARSIAERDYPTWRLAREGDADMPSVKASSKRDEDKPWKNDMWLPRQLILQYESEGEPWDADGSLVTWMTLASEYANTDSAVLVPLWLRMEAEIKRRGYWDIYLDRLHLPRIAQKMERRGVTISGTQTDELIDEYSVEVDLAQAECMAIAAQFDFDLELPAGASPNDSIREFFWGSTRYTCRACNAEYKHKQWLYGPLTAEPACAKCAKKKKPIASSCAVIYKPCLGLEPIYSEKSKSGGPSLDKAAIDQYKATLPAGPALEFILSLTGMRSRQTAVSYMRSYKRFWRPTEHPGWYRLHPSMNPTGTNTLRWAGYNPNSTNISKKEDFNLRRCFGPAPGREWVSMDGKNLELRIPAYESGEVDLIALFERPKNPPFYGSQHLLNFSVVYPDIWEDALRNAVWDIGDRKDKNWGRKIDETLVGPYCKEKYAATWYQWCKNGDFAIQYNCGEKTADRSFHRAGAFKRLKSRFAKLEALNQHCIAMANRLGYVETIPDLAVSAVGYPILASRRDDGRVADTTPLNYHVSGTAMQWTNRAMIETDRQITEWNGQGWDGFLTLQIHDELVFDMPKGTGEEPWRANLDKIRILQRIMEEGGAGINVPTPVSVEYHAENWSVGLAL